MSESEELPPWHGRVQAVCVVVAIFGLIVLLSKVSLECTTGRQASILFFICIKSWVAWLMLIIGAVGWGILTWAATAPAPAPKEKEDDFFIPQPVSAPVVESEPPRLDLPTNRRAKNIDERISEVLDALESFNPKPRERYGEFPDQTYDYLKDKLPKKFWIIAQYKRKGNRGPHIEIDREVGLDLIDATENNLRALHARLGRLRVEYKKIILVLWDHGRVSGSTLDSESKAFINDNPELKGVVVIKV